MRLTHRTPSGAWRMVEASKSLPLAGENPTSRALPRHRRVARGYVWLYGRGHAGQMGAPVARQPFSTKAARQQHRWVLLISILQIAVYFYNNRRFTAVRTAESNR